MKKLLLLFVLTFSFAFSCSRDEEPNENECNCTKTYYLYYPSMGSGPSYIPAHYDVVNQEQGNFNCEDETANYVPVSDSQYSHYKINCE